jgi:hypothetical protein
MLHQSCYRSAPHGFFRTAGTTSRSHMKNRITEGLSPADGRPRPERPRRSRKRILKLLQESQSTRVGGLSHLR